MDTNWKKVPVEPTDEMLNATAIDGVGALPVKNACCTPTVPEDVVVKVYKAMIAASPEYKPSHSLEEDFQHFLAYNNWLGLSDDEIARLRIAYEHGASRGE